MILNKYNIFKYLGGLTLVCGLPAFFVFGAVADAAEAIPEIIVTGRRLSPSWNEPVYATASLSRDALSLSAGARLDDALRAIPGFGLFRRQSSRASHPTTQGVSLRGLGPSGAGRTLVLLDGIPQNDAFGGWIDWSLLPTASIGTASITRGGGAGPWGNAALAGVIRLQGRDIERDAGFAEISAGPHATFDATASVEVLGANSAWQGLAHGHHTDGTFLIGKAQRGPVDRRAADRGALAQMSGRVAINEDTIVRGVARYSESRLINGIAISESETRVADAALSLLHDPRGDTSWEINTYARDQAFRAVFAAVNVTRTIATPSLDQFVVPSRAYGANGILRHRFDDQLSLDLGADARLADGATNENFQNIGQGFTRVRRAGGEQTLAGAFAELNWQPVAQILATVGGRVDSWQQSGGERRETSLQNGAVLRDDRFADRDGSIGTVRGAVRYEATSNVAFRAAAYTGFRLPTLNELYRPFRVGNDITEANPKLDLERVAGLDFGADWIIAPNFKLTTTYFNTVLKDAVTNVTIRSTPGLDPTLNVLVPVGGVLRQRQNLERIETDGFEVDLTAELSPQWQASLRYLFTSPEVTRSSRQPTLQGLRLAQVSTHQASAQFTWTPREAFSIAASLRGATKQFDDDQNTRVLSEYVVADASAEVALTESVRLTLAIENVLNKTLESGRSADGLVSVGTPRTARMGLRLGF